MNFKETLRKQKKLLTIVHFIAPIYLGVLTYLDYGHVPLWFTGISLFIVLQFLVIAILLTYLTIKK
jgi:hypothetical protein